MTAPDVLFPLDNLQSFTVPSKVDRPACTPNFPTDGTDTELLVNARFKELLHSLSLLT
jgi:hypothetical protein